MHRMVAVIMLLLLVTCSGVNGLLVLPASAETKQQQLEREKQQAQSQLNEINQQIKNHDTAIQNAKEQQAAMQTQSNLITQQIDLLVQQIELTQAMLLEKQALIDEKQAEIDQRWDDFKERMAAMQQIHDRGGIAILSKATNLYELLTFNETLKSITEKDNQVLAEMSQAKQELEQEKEELTIQQEQLESQQTQLSDKITELAASIQAASDAIDEEEAAKKADEVAAAAARKALDAAANALDSYLRSQNNAYANSNVKFDSSLGFKSPLPTYKYMSCAFGGSGNHKGVDWAAPGGTPIYAAASGVVTVAKFDPSYGNYVQVYHGADDKGATYATLYAHMNSWPVVSVGQKVSRGDLLGYVGTTGNSTGNHLHLELRVNGNRTNPENYIPRPG